MNRAESDRLRRALFCVALVALLFSLSAEKASAQTVVELRPGLYCAGIPSEEFEYYAAPETSGKQRQTNWCWAACIQMILNFHGIEVTQEEIVRRIFGTLVDTPANADTVLTAVTGWAVTSMGRRVMVSATPFIFSGNEIVYDLAYQNPLIIGLTAAEGIGHACVLTAVCYTINPYTRAPVFQSVVIRDPWPGRSSRVEMSWNEFYYRLIFIARVSVSEVSP